MGFWSGLGKAIGKIAPIAGGIAGAPFTGGASLFAALAPTIGQTVGSALSGAAGGMAGRRDIINEQRLRQQQLAQNAAYQRFLSELDAAKYGVSEQQRGARQALVSQLLENMPQFGLQGMSPRIGQTSLTNTFAPSQDLLSRLAQAGPTAPTMADTPAAQFQDAGFLEKLAGGAGLGLGVLGSLGQRRSEPALQQFASLPNLGSVRMGQLQANNPMRFIQPTVPPQKHALIGDKGYL